MATQARFANTSADGSPQSSVNLPAADEDKNGAQSGFDPDAKQEPTTRPWPAFIHGAKDKEIKERFGKELAATIKGHALEKYCTLVLLEPDDSIDSFELDHIFSGLRALNPKRDKDVLLILLSRGGSIEPAYQISKLCKSFAAERFVAVVPRIAKSAATLIALGADEIHIGPLGQLGPIDPQLGGGLPALGVSQALKTIASTAQAFQGSAEMFARYLQRMLTVEQIGYCDRICESAVQYAVRLLSTKPKLAPTAEAVAKELVHEYKDHSFVIDLDEARKHLGNDWIKTDTEELSVAEDVYALFEHVNLSLNIIKSKHLFVAGDATNLASIHIFKNTR